MGRRELLLLLAFVIAGAVVYQVTAPASDPAAQGRSWTDVFRNVRGEMFGSRARVAVERTVRASVGPDVKALDLGDLAGQVTVVGEAREDIEATVRVSLLGENEGEINLAAAQLAVKAEEQGDTLRLGMAHPDEWRLGRGRVVADVSMKVPERLLVKLDGRGTVNVQGTAGASLDIVRGNVTLERIVGPVTGEFRDGSLEVTGAASVDVTTRRVSVRLAQVEGDVRIEATDGQVRAAGLPGAVKAELRRVMLDLEDIGGAIEVEGADGRTEVRGLKGPLTVDVERMGVAASMVQAAEVRVEVADAPLEFTLPPRGGVTLEIEAADGTIEAPASLGAVEKDGNTQRLKAEVRSGGPVVRLRGARTGVVVRLP